MSFTTHRTILFGDCDPAGVVYTPRVSYFVIEAVQDFMTHALGAPAIREIFAMGILPPARALAIEFLAPMVWDEVIAIRVSTMALSTSSFSFLVEGRNSAAEMTFRATLTQVAISPQSKRPVPLPQTLRDALSVT